MDKHYISTFGYQKLVAERDHLTKVERPEVTKVVSWAASLGDRSENADYQYGKKRLREIDRRVRFLNTRINTAETLSPFEKSSDKVLFGATVDCVDEEDEKKRYTILGKDEVDTKRGIISYLSPIGKKLIGLSVGDSVEVKAPGGTVELTIIAINFINVYEDKK